MKRTISLVLWAVCILALLAGCSNQEHKLLRVNADSNTSEMIFSEFNTYPMDAVSTMDTDIYMLSTMKDDVAASSYIRKYNENIGDMDICIEKYFTDAVGWRITAFACNNENIYVMVNNMEAENDTYIEIYDIINMIYLASCNLILN